VAAHPGLAVLRFAAIPARLTASIDTRWVNVSRSRRWRDSYGAISRAIQIPNREMSSP
jgi:hypothetical protein